MALGGRFGITYFWGGQLMTPIPIDLPALLFWRWIMHLRGAGQIVVGLADNSVIPLPGSLDVFTIYLAASAPRYWPYYAVMATLGALVGGYITYLLAREGGKEAVERRFNKKKAEKLFKRFEKHGIRAISLPALLPPPFPMVPFLIAAGALQYPQKKFIGALALGRGARFTILAWLGAHYGTAITGFFHRYYEPTLFVLIGFSVIGSILALAEYFKHRKPKGQPTPKPGTKVA